MTNKGHMLTILVASVGLLSACGGVDDGTTTDPTPDPGSTTGNEDTTFDHDNSSNFDPFELIDRLAKEGPPRFTARVHSCPKVRYRTLGNVLTSFGINAADTTNLSAGQLYTDGFNALGGPNYANRIRENLNITTASASREFDIFAAASQAIIDGMPNLVRCQINGAPTAMFDASNACTANGIQCLIGAPATAAHLDFCNITVNGASSVDVGKRIAVAAILAAAYTCE
jgi:hypothetical protein